MIFLDFEASAGMGGYPIEVGFSAVGADRCWRSAAKLIRCDEWLDDFSRWDWRAQDIHKITKRNLTDMGESPSRVMTWLNAELAGTMVVADSPMDELWMRELVEIAGVAPTFCLTGDIRQAFIGPEIECEADTLEVNRIAPKRHRAADDAEHLAVKYVMSLRHGAPVHRLALTEGGQIERRAL